MKKLLLLLFFVSGVANATTVPITNAAFLAKLIALGYDTNSSGDIDTNEALAVTTLNISTSGTGISDVAGIEYFTNLTSLNCSGNSLTFLGVNNLTNLTVLNCNSNYITVLNVASLTNLTSLSCIGNQIQVLDVTNLTQLVSLRCELNSISVLNVTNLTSLVELDCNANNIQVLDLLPLTQLSTLLCDNNQMSVLDLSSMVNLTTLSCIGGGITSTTLNVAYLTHLTSFSCGGNAQFTSIDVSGMVNLNGLGIYGMYLTNVNLGTLPNLSSIVLQASGLTTLDLTSCTNPSNPLFQVYLHQNPYLTSINLKNGNSIGIFDVTNNALLNYICADDSNLAFITSSLSTAVGNNPNININSYCSFTPGGTSFPITGVAHFDTGGCVGPAINNVRMGIVDSNSISGATFTNTLGNYEFHVPQTSVSSVTITPYFDNPNYFSVSPPSATITSAQTQDFCISAIGVNPDLEIILMPMGQARPGFDATYKLIYKNKGNQIIPSGTINLAYDDLKTHFVTAMPTISSPPNNPLGWSYNNLLPLETRLITFTLNLNTPVDPLYPVNGGDILTYNSTIDPVIGDITPFDNSFTFHQTVVNSFDPNDKTCLEGDIIDPAKIGEYLHYNINFENTGSASAINIVVKDVIDSTKFDISTLQLMDSSHPVKAKITGNVVEFIFEGINLPPTVTDPTLSHGNVAFKIKTLPILVIGDQVANTANIYFDYNAPITTNTAASTFNTLSTAGFTFDHSVTVYPNPSRNNVMVKAKTAITSIQIFDVQGRVLQTVIENTDSALLDVSDKRNGVYFLKVNTMQGSSIEKIIKE